MRFWFKISIRQNSTVDERRWVNFLTMVGKLEASTVCLRESTRRVQLYGIQAAGDRVQSRSSVACSSGWPRAQSDGQGQAKKAPISSWDFAWNFYSLFKCAQDNSPWYPAHVLQMTSCSAVVWSQSHISSHSLINNLIVCNKSCYCSIINRKLNNKLVK